MSAAGCGSYEEWVEGTKTIRRWVAGGGVSTGLLHDELVRWADWSCDPADLDDPCNAVKASFLSEAALRSVAVSASCGCEADRLNAVARVVSKAWGAYVPLSVRYRAARAADAVVVEWMTRRWCSSTGLVNDDGVPERCVLYGSHEWHEDAQGFRWTDLGADSERDGS